MARRQLYRFSFREHEISGDATDAAHVDAALLQAAKDEAWTAIDSATTDASVPIYEDQTLTELRAQVIESLDGGDGDPATKKLVAIPFKKLREKMSKDKLRFVGGGNVDFEGNHGDTQIYVLLEDPNASADPPPPETEASRLDSAWERMHKGEELKRFCEARISPKRLRYQSSERIAPAEALLKLRRSIEARTIPPNAPELREEIEALERAWNEAHSIRLAATKIE